MPSFEAAQAALVSPSRYTCRRSPPSAISVSASSRLRLSNDRIYYFSIYLGTMVLNQVLSQVLNAPRQPLPLPDPRVMGVRGMPHVFQLLEYEMNLPGLPDVRGLNARKLAGLLGYESISELCDTSGPPLPAREPSWTPEARERGLVAHGGHLASGGGALLPAMAQVCAARGSTLTYHTPPLPPWLTDEPRGHLEAALRTGGLRLVEHADIRSYHNTRNAVRNAARAEGGHYFVPQGGTWQQAEPGVAALARTVARWWRTRPGGGLDVPACPPEMHRGLDVVLPAGSGVTALFLARHVHLTLTSTDSGIITELDGGERRRADIRVYAVPVDGDAAGLVRRMEALDKNLGGNGIFPRVLEPPSSHGRKFGRVAAPLLGTWRRAAEAGVLLDLVYGAVAWGALEACDWCPAHADLHIVPGSSDDSQDREVLYINTGGHEGLEAQLRRYVRAGLLRKLERSSLFGDHFWYEGQWDVKALVKEVKALAAQRSGLVHTRDAGL